jgi:hypothetical protein
MPIIGTPGEAISTSNLGCCGRRRGRFVGPEIPPSVFADARGTSPVTAMNQAELAGTDYLRYAGGHGRVDS